ncbi:MAG: hypothetical protein SFV81_21820 [Pirellulaceae bacterium]|nr:hypothetical protein [Pirellulaceae bacterium]
MKIILAILASIGAIVVLAIAVIVVLYFIVVRRITLRVRQSLRDFEAMQGGNEIDADYFRAIEGGVESEFEVPPMRIHLHRASPKIWMDEAGMDETGVAEGAKWIESHGFEFVGDFLIKELPESRLKVFVSDDRWLVATIRQDHSADPAYTEFCFDLGHNQRGGVSNPPNATVPLPAGAIGEHFSDDFIDGVHVLPKMLERARELAEDHAASKVDRNKIEEFFEAAHATEMDMRIERGGLTAEEIRLALEHDQQSVSKSEIEGIQRDWQGAIEQFLVDQSPKGAECLDEDGEVVAVYDGSLSSFLLDRFNDFYSSEVEVDSEELLRIMGELETLLRLFKPREAIARFRPLLPESMRFSLIDQLHKPVEADLYLLPQ